MMISEDDIEQRCNTDHRKEKAEDRVLTDADSAKQEHLFGCSCFPISSKCCDADSATFSLRVTLALTASCLFVTLPSISKPYPEAVWVFTTACVTSWLPSPDVATACKKTYQRSIGTCIGALAGLMTGFIYTLIPQQSQALFLSIIISAETVIASYAARLYGFQSNYAALLSQLTFGIVALSFHEDVEDPWRKGVFRMANILLGSSIGGLTAIVIRPISVKTVLKQKIHQQTKLAGVSAQEVLLLASDSFNKQRRPDRFVDLVRNKTEDPDEAYNSSVQGLSLWKECTSLFSMLEYDPMYQLMPAGKKARLRDSLQEMSARTLLIQNSIVMMDTVIRGGVQHVDHRVGTQQLMKSVGEDLRILLDNSGDVCERNQAADELLYDLLPSINSYASEMRCLSPDKTTDGTATEHLHDVWTSFEEGTRPLVSLESSEQIVMFFDLLQHVVLRSVRQYHFVSKQ